MKNALFALLLVMMVSVIHADSDAIGIIAGTQEPLSLALYNSSSGNFSAFGLCSIEIRDSVGLVVGTTNMTNDGDGIYSYLWDVPQESGIYRVLMNCTGLDSSNYSAGGALYVSPRSFEKTVAQGVEKYGPQYAATYQSNWWDSTNNKVIIVVVGILFISLGLYVYDNYLARIGR